MIANRMLFFVSCVLCLVSIFVIAKLEFQHYLITRIVAVFCFLFFIIYHKVYKNSQHFLVFLLFVVFELLLYNVKLPVFSKIAFVLRGIMYAILIASIYKFLKFNVKNIVVTGVFLVIIGINCYMLYSLIQLVDDRLMTTTHRILSIVSCSFIVMACVAAANYNFNKFSLQSTLFLVFVYAFALSDITSFNGFYLGIDILYYPDRLFALIGYTCFILYASLSNKLRDRNSQLK